MSYPESCNYNPIGQLIENKAEQIQYFYNASGLVTEVWYEGSPKVKFMYNDRNHRVKKESYHNGSLLNSTFYVRDVAGQVMAIFTEDGSQPQLVEQPIYGAARIGVQYTHSLAVYELTDHLGNVRALFTKESATDSKLEGYTDYYPFGMPMPNRQMRDANQYRYAFQGQEKDSETGKEAFELRLWDSRIGRWLTTDPAKQYSSPYLGMGNNPINGIDPDGAVYNPVYGSDGTPRGNTVEGFTGEAIVYDGNLDFSGLSAGDLIGSGGTYLSDFTFSSFTIRDDIISHIVNANINDGLDIAGKITIQGTYADYNFSASDASPDNLFIRRGINRDSSPVSDKHFEPTVENLRDIINGHEVTLHTILDIPGGAKNHFNIYGQQVNHPHFQSTTRDYQIYIVSQLAGAALLARPHLIDEFINNSRYVELFNQLGVRNRILENFGERHAKVFR